jgi:hypothetical protein
MGGGGTGEIDGDGSIKDGISNEIGDVKSLGTSKIAGGVEIALVVVVVVYRLEE